MTTRRAFIGTFGMAILAAPRASEAQQAAKIARIGFLSTAHPAARRGRGRGRMIVAEGGWAPYLSLDDAHKLDEVRKVLRRGDIRTASRLARVFRLTPLSA